MVGSYPLDSAGVSILTAVLFVVLLVPLMIPKVPYKALNAIVFFGVFPIVGFMLLIGVALPFGLVGLIALIVNFVIWLVGAVLGLIVVIPGIVLSGIGKIGLFIGLPDGFGDFLRIGSRRYSPRQLLRRLAVRQCLRPRRRPVAPRTESQLGGQVPSLWIDLGLSAAAVLGLMLWLRSSPRAIVTTARRDDRAGRRHLAHRARCRPAAVSRPRSGAGCW